MSSIRIFIAFLIPSLLLSGCSLGVHSYKNVRVKVLDAEARPEIGMRNVLVRVFVPDDLGIEIRPPKPDMQFTDVHGEAVLRVPTREQHLVWQVFETGYCGYEEQHDQKMHEQPPDEKVFRIFRCPQEMVKKSIEFTRAR